MDIDSQASILSHTNLSYCNSEMLQAMQCISTTRGVDTVAASCRWLCAAAWCCWRGCCNECEGHDVIVAGRIDPICCGCGRCGSAALQRKGWRQISYKIYKCLLHIITLSASVNPPSLPILILLSLDVFIFGLLEFWRDKCQAICKGNHFQPDEWSAPCKNQSYSLMNYVLLFNDLWRVQTMAGESWRCKLPSND